MQPSPAAETDRLRSRALGTYFSAAALVSIAYIGIYTVSSLAAPQISGFAGSSGWPNSAGVGGTAIAAAYLSSVMARRGRRAGLVLGISVSVLGGLLALVAVMVSSLLLLLLAVAGVGFGNAAMNLARYAAADMYAADRRAGALGLVVWGSTIGAVLGPNLVGPAGTIGVSLGFSALVGGFVVALAFLLAALAVAAFGPRPPHQPHLDEPARPVGEAPVSRRRLLADLVRRPRGRIALVALVTSQLVMTLVMVMTPYHLHELGHGLSIVGFVISAHTFGMFAFSPLSGRLVDRFGAVTMVVAGFSVLAVAGVMAATMPNDAGGLLAVPLFLLGVGWNLGFVAGSALLTAEAPVGDRARLQGASDAVVWTTAAAASFGAGFVVAAAGYGTLSIAGASVAVLLGLVVIFDRRAVAARAS